MKVIFYDSDCISCFLLINKSNFFKKLFNEIIITEQVYKELTEIHTPEIIRKELKKLIQEKYIKIHEISIYSKTHQNYKLIKKGHYGIKIDDGEASVIACSIEHDGIIASNNLSDVLYYVKKFNLGLITTAIMFTLLYEKKIITIHDADKLWKKLIKYNRRLPAASFSEYYEKLFKKDYKEFNCEKYYKEL